MTLETEERDPDLTSHQYIDTMPKADVYHDSSIILRVAAGPQMTGKSSTR
jgi:hypothetical protein